MVIYVCEKNTQVNTSRRSKLNKKNRVLFIISILLAALVIGLTIIEAFITFTSDNKTTKNPPSEVTQPKDSDKSKKDNENTTSKKEDTIQNTDEKTDEKTTQVEESSSKTDEKPSGENETTEPTNDKLPATETDENSVLINYSLENALINRDHKLPEGYEPPDLVTPKLPAKSYTDENKKMRLTAALALEKLFAAAKEDGYTLYVISGYRPYSLQKSIYDSSVERVGVEETEKLIAIPGSSEHQSGLAMDVSCESENFQLEESLGNKPEGIWIAENAHKFGFIVRYPKDKEDITKISYEPWHLRYVGIDMATDIYERKICLEEYYQ